MTDATEPAAFANASAWYNLTTWASDIGKFAPSFDDLRHAGPRMFRKLGSFLPVPESFQDQANSAIDLFRSAPGDVNTFTGNTETSTGGGGPLSNVSRITLDSARGLGSVLSYATSRWALSCIVMAIVINRTHIFAATRRRLRLRWKLRLLLRILPIVMLALEARRLLQSIQCQTSANFSMLRWNNATKSSDLMFASYNPAFNTMTSALLLGASDEASCVSVGMVPDPTSTEVSKLRGSLSALWPLFGSFCLSHFVETVSCAVQGRPLATETGMTLFEQSLAFAEADATVHNQISHITFGASTTVAEAAKTALSGSVTTLTKAMVLKRVNTAPEVLLVAFLSTMTHISSHVLGVFDLQAKYRLFNTGFWGLCFMASIVWSTLTFELDDPASHGLLRFPTVCVIGFVPHVLVLFGIILCMSIYALALLLSAFSSTTATEERAGMTFRQRLVYAHENMQANVSFSEIRITRDMDFYTALLRTGFAAITMASEAVYLNEDSGVSLKRHTWLEEARYQEAEELQKQWIGIGAGSSRYDHIGAIGLIPVKPGATPAPNGYARERAAQKVPKSRHERSLRMGAGQTERSSRWVMAVEFVASILRLILKVSGLIMLWMLKLVRIRYQPAWLLWMARHPKPTVADEGQYAAMLDSSRRRRNEARLMETIEGIDVGAEIRRANTYVDEDHYQDDVYRYFREGGPWGSGDASGEYVPTPEEDNFDTTSFVSMSTTTGQEASEDEGWESEASGQRTPTQRSPRFTRENTPVADSPMDTNALARLLRPSTKEEREEAANLAAHFQSDRIMTRASFRRLEQLRRTRVLTSPARRQSLAATPGPRHVKLNADEEEKLLEQLLLQRRQDTLVDNGESAVEDDSGPQCVVCQSAPRAIIVWPCRCLSLCDDCRVSLAMNNFDKCVCCRRDVLSFSRIYVP